MFELQPHGGSAGVDGVRLLGNARHDGMTLTLTFAMTGALDRVSVPAPVAPGIADGLWRRTCFEAFISCDGAEAYHELNLSPSSAWAVLAFATYREGGLVDDGALAPRTRIHRGTEELRLEAVVPLARLDPSYVRGPVRVGLSAVVEDVGGACSYWALAHAAGVPDFHCSAGWTLRLEAPSGACDGEAS